MDGSDSTPTSISGILSECLDISSDVIDRTVRIRNSILGPEPQADGPDKTGRVDSLNDNASDLRSRLRDARSNLDTIENALSN